MYAFTVDYLRRDRPEGPRLRGQLLHRGFFITGLPRLRPLCRLLGHKPVVDGTDSDLPHPDGQHNRWVVCDRCGVRPHPQGHLDPGVFDIGERYECEFGPPPPPPGRLTVEAFAQLKEQAQRFHPPGPWPEHLPAGPEGRELGTGGLGAQLSIGYPGSRTWGWELKVGNAGSEHTIAASFRAGPLGSIYLNTEAFGTWLQRRLNPTGYVSKLIGLEVNHGDLHWKLWAPRDRHYGGKVPRWRDGRLNLDLVERVWGRKRYRYDKVPDSLSLVKVRCADGDDHLVTLTLEREYHGRHRWPLHQRFTRWMVSWECQDGIPTKTGGRGRYHGASVPVSAAAVRAGTWTTEAASAIAAQVATWRTRERYNPTGITVTTAAV